MPRLLVSDVGGRFPVMLFSVLYSRRLMVDDEAMKQVHRLFMAWEPPQDLSIRFHYVYASGGRGLAVVEAPDAALIREATAPFIRALEFQVEPVISAPEALAIAQHVAEWSDSV